MRTEIWWSNPVVGQRGFTLVELLVFMVVVAIGLVSLLKVFDRAVGNSVDPVVQVRALECAQAKLDEVLARRFDESTPVGGVPACGSASTGAVACTGIVADMALDDVGDYNGTVDDTLDNCSVAVVVAEAGADLGMVNSRARRITVTSESNGGGQVVLSVYRVNF